VYEGELREGWRKVVIPFTTFAVAATTKDYSFGTQVAGTEIVEVYLDVVKFTGTAGTVVIDVGINGGGDHKIFAAKDVKSADVKIGRLTADYSVAPGMGDEIGANGFSYCPDFVSSYTISLRMTSGSGNLSALNAGSITAYITTKRV
jgi:hypothetical protein